MADTCVIVAQSILKEIPGNFRSSNQVVNAGRGLRAFRERRILGNCHVTVHIQIFCGSKEGFMRSPEVKLEVKRLLFLCQFFYNALCSFHQVIFYCGFNGRNYLAYCRVISRQFSCGLIDNGNFQSIFFQIFLKLRKTPASAAVSRKIIAHIPNFCGKACMSSVRRHIHKALIQRLQHSSSFFTGRLICSGSQMPFPGIAAAISHTFQTAI